MMKEGKISLDRTQIKYIAIAAMLLDHMAVFLLPPEKSPAQIVLYVIMRTIGRITAPVMFYFVGEGYLYTSSRLKYGIRLLCFGLVSQAPYMLLRFENGMATNLNVIITLFFTFLMLDAVNKAKKQPIQGIVITAFVILTMSCDWGMIGPILAWMFFGYRSNCTKHLIKYAVISALMFISIMVIVQQTGQQWYEGIYYIGMFLVIPLLKAYNREADSKSKIHKWFFYVFYPLHLLLLWIIL
ncbi:MAG: hypothetical protein IKP88_12265 [Lachnospiraceae bacterium]|nr:hypothetical protein [Lachnospiraceae bacterium]